MMPIGESAAPARTRAAPAASPTTVRTSAEIATACNASADAAHYAATGWVVSRGPLQRVVSCLRQDMLDEAL